MKYDLKNKFKPFTATLTVVMKDGSGYPVSNFNSDDFDFDLIMKEYNDNKIKGTDAQMYISKARKELCEYIERESKKINVEGQIGNGERVYEPYEDLIVYVYRLLEETLLGEAKQMIDDDYVDYFDFSEWGTIYSKAEFKKAYVSRIEHE